MRAPRIIQLRGTSGSGKTTIVRNFMDQHFTGFQRMPVFVEGRKQPLLYQCVDRNGLPALAVIGHYESPCGGTDTISGYDRIYQLVEEQFKLGYSVLFEGLLSSDERSRTIKLNNDTQGGVTCILLNTPVDQCIDSVNERRRAKDPNKPDVDPKNTVMKHRSTKRTLQVLQENGVNCVVASREETAALIPQLLGL